MTPTGLAGHTLTRPAGVRAPRRATRVSPGQLALPVGEPAATSDGNHCEPGPGPDAGVTAPHPVAAWSKPAGRPAPGGRRIRSVRSIQQRYETGEQRACESCALVGRIKLGVTRSPGLIACLTCWERHERAGIWPTAQRPHDVDVCRLCRPAIQPPEDDEDTAPILGSLLPYNPVDRPLSASRPALADPWQAVALAQRFADEHAASQQRLRMGFDFGRVEVAVAEVYAALTVAYGPVVRPSVREVYTRVGCGERRAQYALRALQRAGLLYQHSDGCLVRGDDGDVERLAAEYELRIPLAYLDRAQLMDELDEGIDRDLLERYLEAVAAAREATAPQSTSAAEAAPGPADVDDQCTPSVGLLFPRESRSSETLSDQDKMELRTDKLGRSPVGQPSTSPSARRPRMRRGYALARRLQDRAPRWTVVPLPVLAAALVPLADLGWSSFQVDRATITYGPVTSSSGLTRTLRAVIDYATDAPGRRHQAQVDAMTKQIIAAELASRRSPAVWTDTSDAARQAYELAAQARVNPTTAPAVGWETLRAAAGAQLADDTSDAPVDQPANPESLSAARRSAEILARARLRAARERAPGAGR